MLLRTCVLALRTWCPDLFPLAVKLEEEIYIEKEKQCVGNAKCKSRVS